ncbi:MAG: hypothetical protein JWO94_1876 [Verrucomicrobiaceae bacterium]|nr:hypothetical protein [Verrucomicrobiaceae bacterium]
MNLARIAWRYLWSRPLITIAAVTGIALGVALISAVLTLRRETEASLKREAGLFDLVVGAKGSPLQLVLSTVYHMDVPTGNIPVERYRALKANPQVAVAYAIGLGDNYQGFRIVGTEPAYFDMKSPKTGARVLEFAEGGVYKEPFDVVLGSSIAALTGLKLGSTFAGTHGLVSVPGSAEHSDFPYRVTGILKPSGTAQDRAIFAPLESIWRIHEAEDATHNAVKGLTAAENAGGTTTKAEGKGVRDEITAVLIQMKAPGLRLWLADEIRNGTESMPAIPMNEVLRLYENVLTPMQRALLAVAALVVVVSVLTVMTTLYQAAERRRKDIAIIRTLGARRWEVFFLSVAEAMLLSIIGIVAGAMLGHGGLALAGRLWQASSGIALGAWSMDSTEIELLSVVFICGSFAGLVPALVSYRRSPSGDLHGGS